MGTGDGHVASAPKSTKVSCLQATGNCFSFSYLPQISKRSGKSQGGSVSSQKQKIRTDVYKVFFKSLLGEFSTLGCTLASHRAPQVALVVKNTPANAGDKRDTGSIPGSGRSPGGGNGNPLQYSCLENPMDRQACQATYSPRGHKEWDMIEHLSTWGVFKNPDAWLPTKTNSIRLSGGWNLGSRVPQEPWGHQCAPKVENHHLQ